MKTSMRFSYPLTLLLLIAISWVLPVHSAPPAVEVNPFQTYGHTYDDLLDAVRTLRKKTNQAAFFWLELPQYPTPPVFAPDAAGEAFFVLPVATKFSEQPSAKELNEELSRLRSSARFKPSYDSTLRRLAYYPPEAVAELSRSLAPWLVPNEQLAKLPFFAWLTRWWPRASRGTTRPSFSTPCSLASSTATERNSNAASAGTNGACSARGVTMQLRWNFFVR